MIPANHVLPKLKSSRTGHAALSPRRRNRAVRAGNEILSDTRVHQLELKAYLYRAITRRTYEREIRELPLLFYCQECLPED